MIATYHMVAQTTFKSTKENVQIGHQTLYQIYTVQINIVKDEEFFIQDQPNLVFLSCQENIFNASEHCDLLCCT